MNEKVSSPPGGAARPVVEAYREKILYALALIGTLVLLPFSVANFFKGYPLIGALSMLVVLIFVADAYAIYRGRHAPVPMPLAFAVILLTLAVAILGRGLLGIFWSFPAILLFHFVLERRFANLFNLTLVAVVGAVSFYTLEADVALRIVAGQLLTIIFTNIFSYVVEAEQRKEIEQRRRLGLLVRATQAGFYQWDRGAAAVTYSGRLKEMLGYPPEADTSGWPAFPELVHPDDRAHRYELFQKGARDRSVKDGVRRHVGGDFRMFHANGGTIWVHSEGLFIHDADGIAQRYIASLIDVTERYRQQEELRRSHNQIEVQAQQLRDQNAALREAMRVREEVERIARHDLKTPLNSILAVPRMLREGRAARAGAAALTPEEEALLGMVEGAAYRILDMVNRSVDLYRMEQGDYRFSPRVVDLVALADTVAREVRAHASTKGVRIEILVDGEPAGPARRAFAWAEELLCYSLMANLLNNAVEASPDGGAVTLEFQAHGPQAVLRIHNDGVVPEAMRGRFFEKYATSGKVGGFGLGTYSARLMARVQQGEIAMRTSEAEGTVIEVRLPALPPGASTALPGVRAAGAAAPAKAERALPRLRVLVADDDEFNVAFVRSALPSPPLEVTTAINGRAALDAVRASPPDVVFLDLEMPVMNGFDALAQLRALEAREGRKPAVVIAFSSYDDESVRRRCREAGFDAYLGKPAPRDRIHDILHAVAEGQPLPAALSGDAPAPAGGAPGPEDAVVVDADLEAAMPRFLESRRAVLAELCAALAAGERDAAARLAHKLAGAFSLYRFEWAAAASRVLEQDAAEGDLALLGRRCGALQAHLENVRLQLRGNMREGHGSAQEAAAGG